MSSCVVLFVQFKSFHWYYKLGIFSRIVRNTFLLKSREVNKGKLCVIFKSMLYSDILNKAKIKWLSLSFFFFGIKISIIHQPENYLINISSHLLAQERSHIVFSFFLFFSWENLSISCWLLDWLQRDSLKILKKNSGIQYKSNISCYQSCA